MNNENGNVVPLQNTVLENQVEYFAVSTIRLVLLSVITFGIYEVYWFYKNWNAINRTQKKQIYPIVRAIFPIFFCYSLFKKIHQSAKETGYSKRILYPGLLAVFYIILTILLKILYRLDMDSFNFEMFLLVLSITPYIPLVYMQELINFNNAKIVENYTVTKNYTTAEIVIVVIGAVLFVLYVFYWVDLFFLTTLPY